MSATLTRDMGVRELSIQEIDEVGGGPVWFIPVAIFVGKAVLGSAAAAVVVGAAHGLYDGAVGNPRDSS